MTTPIDRERLLADTFEDDDAFRAASLEATLRAVRGHQVTRRRQRNALAAGFCLAVGILVVVLFPQPRPQSSEQARLSASASTASDSATIHSTEAASLTIVTTGQSGVETIQTKSAALVEVRTVEHSAAALFVDDAGLFTLLAGRPVAIVRQAGTPAELVLLDEGLSADSGTELGQP